MRLYTYGQFPIERRFMRKSPLMEKYPSWNPCNKQTNCDGGTIIFMAKNGPATDKCLTIVFNGNFSDDER